MGGLGSASVSAWTDYALALQPGLAYIYQRANGLPAWVPLAMAAHESGVPPISYSTYVTAHNPWGIVDDPLYPTVNGFTMYPSLQAAWTAFPGRIPASALAVAQSPAAFMQALQADGWDGPPPASNGYASSVLYTWGPNARAALTAIGADPVTGMLSAPVTTPTPPQPDVYSAQAPQVPWTAIGIGALIVGGGLAVASGGRRRPRVR